MRELEIGDKGNFGTKGLEIFGIGGLGGIGGLDNWRALGDWIIGGMGNCRIR